jgi:hypothetical protein
MVERRRKALRTARIALQQMVGHALGRLGSDAWQAAECLDEFIEA